MTNKSDLEAETERLYREQEARTGVYIAPPSEPSIGDWVGIDVPHLGHVSGKIIGVCSQPQPRVAVHWLCDTIDVIDRTRIVEHSDGWYVEGQR